MVKKLGQIWEAFAQLGVSKYTNFSVQSRIRLANTFSAIQVGLGFFLLAAFSSQEHFNALPFLIFILVSVGIPVFNWARAHQLARYLLSLMPMLTVLAYDLSAKLFNPKGQEIISYVSPRFVITSSVCVPLVMFTFRERAWLFSAALPVVLASLFFDEIYRWFGVHYSQLGLSSRLYGLVGVNVVVVLVILLSTFWFLMRNNAQNEAFHQATEAELARKNEALLEKEQLLQQQLSELEQRRSTEAAQVKVHQALQECVQALEKDLLPEEIYPLVLRQMGRFLHIFQGVFYQYSKNDTPQLVACRGLSKEDFLLKSHLTDEGLLQQAFITGKMQMVHPCQ
ncbi:MAG: hypothetical protein HC913_18320 [Microscillaceae bacterium]|nr:hypothetical protein [Microscillaceae bacterium]